MNGRFSPRLPSGFDRWDKDDIASNPTRISGLNATSENRSRPFPPFSHEFGEQDNLSSHTIQ